MAGELVRWGTFVVRTSGDASRLIPSLRSLVHETNAESPLMYPRTMREITRSFLAPQMLSLGFFGLFAILALTLAGLGVYGVMSYVVAMRTREFGIRTALGARRGMLIWLIVRQSLRPASVGIAAGLGLAFWAMRLMATLFVGVSSHDPLTYLVAPVVLFVLTVLACALPAWRAARVEPSEALRTE